MRPAAHTISSVTVSALVGPGQSRFDALRQFRLMACDSTADKDCSNAANFTTVYTSPAGAFRFQSSRRSL